MELDADGQPYPEVPRSKTRKRKHHKWRPQEQWDIAFGLYVQLRMGKMTRWEFDEITGIKRASTDTRISRYGWREKADAIIAEMSKVSSVKDNGLGAMAANIANIMDLKKQGADGWVSDTHVMLEKARTHFKKLPGGKIIEQARSLSAINDLARKNYDMDKGDKTEQTNASPINLSILLNPTALTVTEVPRPALDIDSERL
ncbi:MAG TPA: hypothetical protein VIT91_07590 [Chthoniobacterales bacterium]